MRCPFSGDRAVGVFQVNTVIDYVLVLVWVTVMAGLD